ncbi:hypothetical protein ACFY1U_40620 [Streptomyces sp. NPDC001351]
MRTLSYACDMPLENSTMPSKIAHCGYLKCVPISRVTPTPASDAEKNSP